MSEPSSKVKCLPTYLLIDTSSSMKDSEVILNDTIEHLYDQLILSPRIAEFAHVCIISFNTGAEVVMPMTDIQQVSALPQLSCGGVTNFGAAFRQLRSSIDLDVPGLVQQGRSVLRPVAFLLTDGQPTDANGYATKEWKTDYDVLVSENWRRRPNIVTFGFGKATEETLRTVATRQGAAFLANNMANQNEALKKVFVNLLNTLVASARGNELRLPAQVDGFIRVSPDEVD